MEAVAARALTGIGAPSTICRAAWRDALLVLEDVAGIVLRLDLAQPAETGSPVGGFPILHSDVRHVDVGTAVDEGPQRLAELGDPGLGLRGDRLAAFFISAGPPADAGLGIEKRVAMRERDATEGLACSDIPAESLDEVVAVIRGASRMNEPTRLVASCGNGSGVNCEKNFQFAGSFVIGIWNPAYIAPAPTCTETSGLPIDRIGASNSFASAADPFARTPDNRISGLWISSRVPRRLSANGAMRWYASKIPCRSLRPSHVACK